jgi:hypothetical protein
MSRCGKGGGADRSKLPARGVRLVGCALRGLSAPVSVPGDPNVGLRRQAVAFRTRSAVSDPRLHRDLLGTLPTRVRHPLHHLLERHSVLRGGHQLDRDWIGKVLHHKILFPDALEPEGRRLRMHENRVLDVPDIPKRHPAFAEGHGNSVPQQANKRRT